LHVSPADVREDGRVLYELYYSQTISQSLLLTFNASERITVNIIITEKLQIYSPMFTCLSNTDLQQKGWNNNNYSKNKSMLQPHPRGRGIKVLLL